MMYPFMTLNDNTEIVHSELINSDEKEIVKVCIEKPVYGGFHSIECILPEYKWINNNGFSNEEIAEFKQLDNILAAIFIPKFRLSIEIIADL